MIVLRLNRRYLSATEFRFRAVYVFAISLGGAVLRFFEPATLSYWLPFHTSCGAITGLPCLFCGMTRALHHLLNGNFSGALYYNWLAFPLLAGAFCLATIFTIELVSRQTLFAIRAHMQFTSRWLASSFAVLVLLWVLQVYLAISQHKQELLNPAGPLYALFVR